MGNFLALCPGKFKQGEPLKDNHDHGLLQIVKMDGKVLEFRNPLLVRDLLANYPNFYVGIFKEASQPLPPEYKLKIGKIYHLLPSFNVEETRKIEAPRKRIKVVISKQQLQQLIAKQGRFEDLILAANESKKDCRFRHASSYTCSRLPKLESIPEESDVVSI